jgi:hypothetical protein
VALAHLALFWSALFALRLAFLAFHWRDLAALWADYERHGAAYQLARALDAATLILFGAASIWALWSVGAQTPDRLGRVFVAWLGFLLLERLPVHRFPRTNVSGGLRDAQVSLLVNVLLALLGAAAATGLAALYFRWRG